jgi:hypothetical protein
LPNSRRVPDRRGWPTGSWLVRHIRPIFSSTTATPARSCRPAEGSSTGTPRLASKTSAGCR